MRVLHVIAGARDGGAESIMADAVIALAEAGVAQHVVTRAHNQDRLAQFAAASVPVSLASFSRLWPWPTARAIARAIRFPTACRPDGVTRKVTAAGSCRRPAARREMGREARG